MMKRFPILVFAMFIDAFQFFIGAALLALPFVGGIAGAAGASSFCRQNLPWWGWLQWGCTAAGAWAGTAVGSAAAPVGVILAPVVVFVIGVVFGPMLVTFLLYSGAFRGREVALAFIGKTTPFVGMLPFWSGMTWQCLWKTAKKEKQEKSAENYEVGWQQEYPARYTESPQSVAVLPLQPRQPPQEETSFGKENNNTQRQKIELKSPDIRRKAPLGASAAALALLLMLGVAPLHTFAQVVPDPVRFTLAPENPGPNELVVIEVDGVGISIGNATITWQLNGKTVLSGVGERKFSFTTGPLGSPELVTATVQSPEIATVTRQFNLTPSVVHLLWQADTTVPFFYRGAPLYSAGSGIKVVAFPNVISGGKEISASSLSYNWSVNGAPVPQQSGLGRTSLAVDGDQLQPSEDIAVDVFFGTAKVGHGEVSIPNTDPALILYYRDPLRGILYDSALPQSVTLGGQEISLRAEPYYFSNASLRSGNLAYSWLLDGTETSGPDSAQGFLTLRRTGGAAGNTTLSVSLQNNDPSQLGQSASAALQIVFGAQASAGGSSLGAAVLSAWHSLTGAGGANSAAVLQYNQPLEPLPYFNYSCVSIGGFLNGALKILISAGAIFAVLTLTVGGVMYMTSEIVSVKSQAKERMWAAIWGLILIIVAYLILSTINPELVNFSNLFPNNCSSTPSTDALSSSSSSNPSAGGAEIKTLDFGSDNSIFSKTTTDVLGRIGSYFGIYSNEETVAAFGCSSAVDCSLASREYLSYSDAAKSSADIQKFKTQCESIKLGTLNTATVGFTRTRPGDPFGDTGKTDMFCFRAY
jgi:hypothetical protein